VRKQNVGYVLPAALTGAIDINAENASTRINVVAKIAFLEVIVFFVFGV
jgi:hypothetical protein